MSFFNSWLFSNILQSSQKIKSGFDVVYYLLCLNRRMKNSVISVLMTRLDPLPIISILFTCWTSSVSAKWMMTNALWLMLTCTLLLDLVGHPLQLQEGEGSHRLTTSCRKLLSSLKTPLTAQIYYIRTTWITRHVWGKKVKYIFLFFLYNKSLIIRYFNLNSRKK